MNREIEVKVRVDDLEEIREKLESQGFVFSVVKKQNDHIFALPEVVATFDTPHTDVNFLRIREVAEKKIFTLKRPIDGNELDCLEYETEINSFESMEAIIKLLGYKHAVSVKKERREGKVGGITVTLDKVEDLGTFMEVERIVEEDSDGEIIKKEIWNFLTDLGISRDKEEVHGYDTLMYKKQIS